MEDNAAASLLQREGWEKQVREQLQKDKIKLWEPPYTTDGGCQGDKPQELIDRYSTSLELPGDTVTVILERLRCHSLEKLASRTKFQKTGVATLKVKLAGCVPEEAKQFTKSPGMTIEIDLKSSGHELKRKVSSRSNVEVMKLKVICGGQVVDDTRPLSEQRVKNQSQLMALCLSESEAAARREQDTAAGVIKTREAAELLSSKEDGDDDEDEGNFYLQVADQTGNKLNIPRAERKALVFAMTLHEKGRAAIRRRDYCEALLLLLEADSEFKQCNAQILGGVDNYALVCLDIVWCYLCLKQITDLPDADMRLQTCDQCLRKSYGPNLERLALVKGETGIERALFMRLHLLQAIVAFYQSKNTEAMALLQRTERELQELQIDAGSMAEVMTMGFTAQEARLSLRACNGSVPLAVSHIMKKREEKNERQKKEREERNIKKIAKRLGKTAEGKRVNVEFYKSLISMGFSKGAAAEALRQSNNDITCALQVLQDHPELLDLPDPEKDKVHVTDDLIAQVTAVGFDAESARIALVHFGGDIQQAVDELLKSGGGVPQDWRDQQESGTSSSEGTSSSSEGSSPTKTPEELQREKEAIDSIVPDIAEDEEAHLDFTLEEELSFLEEYKGLLASLE